MTETVETSAELAAVTEELIDARHEYGELLDRQGAERREAEKEIADLEGRQAHLITGTTDEELRMARDLIEVKGKWSSFSEALIQQVVEDIAAGCLTLRSEYFCTRIHDGRQVAQPETCSYGMVPRHGRVCFSIGLSKNAREFFERWRVVPLGEDGERGHAAIRYLLNLKEAGRP